MAVGEFTGTVREINVLNTVLATIDNKEILVPNSRMTSEVITNYTAQKERRLDLSYSVAYDTDLKLAKKVLSDLIQGDERCLQDPAPIIAVGNYRDSAIELVVRVWVSGDLYWDLYYDMQERVKEAFDENGIEIPFPQIDVHTK